MPPTESKVYEGAAAAGAMTGAECESRRPINEPRFGATDGGGGASARGGLRGEVAALCTLRGHRQEESRKLRCSTCSLSCAISACCACTVFSYRLCVTSFGKLISQYKWC